MQIKKTYKEINPTLLYDEVKEFVMRQGLTLDQNKLETYSMPSDSSTLYIQGNADLQISRTRSFACASGRSRPLRNPLDAGFQRHPLLPRKS